MYARIMASPPRELNIGPVKIYSDETLGVGSYGKVCKAKCGQLACAAKILHETMFQQNDPGINQFVEKFQQECRFLSTIKHPNIVQYLGTSQDPQSRRPVLLMELMDESLTIFLECSIDALPYHSQLNICHDVALALAYLHSNGIIHRDLSSNNVLLTGKGSRAKVTDFGMSKLIDANPHLSLLRVTQCPGTPAYMPPEALIIPPHYSSKLDCFSHGVLTIQIITKEFPNPGDPHRCIQDPFYPNKALFEQIPEIERRKKDIDQVDEDHPLLPTILQCLEKDTERPTADELCDRLATLKSEYSDVQQTRERTFSSQILSLQPEDELIVQLSIKESIIEKLRKELHQKQDQPEKTQPKIPSERCAPSEFSELAWREGKTAPETMTEPGGAAVAHGNTAYFSYGYDVYSYTVPANKWSKLQPSKYQDFSMAVINDKLTTIGGAYHSKIFGYAVTNNLHTLSEGSWGKYLPSMPTKRLKPATVAIPTYLVVAGGMTSTYKSLSTVEILNTETLRWSTASSSPKVDSFFNMTVCDGYFYLSEHKTIFSCSVEELLKSTSTKSSDGGCVWTKLADIPVSHNSLATLRGRVLAIGGVGGGKPTQAIHQYDQNTNSWSTSVIAKLPTPRYESLAVVLLNDELVVVGGYRSPLSKCNITEIAQPLVLP